MSFEWDVQTEVNRYMDLWKKQRPSGIKHSPAFWDERAEDWESELRNDESKKARSEHRINSTVNFLRAQGLLNADDRVIDIGCGPGRFVTEFAKTVEHATGLDLSPRMAEFGSKFAAEQGLKNVSFEACDFKTLDIDEKNWRKQFDLVFASITPAVGSMAEIGKMIDMSRAYCFNSVFVHSHDPVEEELLRDLFQIESSLLWDGRTFYAMFNLLWLNGFFPAISYFKEYSEERIQPSQSFAARIAARHFPDATETDINKIHEYLTARTDDDGLLLYPTTRWYGWMLWDVRNQSERRY